MHPMTLFRLNGQLKIGLLLALAFAFLPDPASASGDDEGKTPTAAAPAPDPGGAESNSRLSNKYTPLQLDDFPERPAPLLEIGQHFLGTGPIDQGFTIPGGAVWQPYLMVFGNIRTGVQTFESPASRLSEWANRIDLFANLYLTFTERIVAGIRPLDRGGRFTSYTIDPKPANGKAFNDRDINAEITTLFFEGDFGELFPFLDPSDRHGWDYGFSVGRQAISFQDGMLINDNLDAAGITKINWKIFSAINFRWTLLYAWKQVNRNGLPGNALDEKGSLVGLFTESDYRHSTIAVDAVFVNANEAVGRGIYAGISTIQRWGGLNTTFRVLGSAPVGKMTETNTRGALAHSDISWTPRGSNNFVYLALFAGIGKFRSAARDPSVGGPLAPQAGVLFAGVGLGQYGSALSNSADNMAGATIGYELFFDDTRQQLLFELGGRYSKDNFNQTAGAFGATYQIAVGRRLVFVLGGFGTYQRGITVAGVTQDNKFLSSGRFEIMLQM